MVYEHPGEGDEVLATFAFSQGVEGVSEWTFQDVRCYIPPEALSVYVQVTLYGQGSAWFDEVTLRVEEKGGV